MDLSQLIVERNTLFSCIVPTIKNDENRLRTLNCLFLMFNNYLVKLKEHNETLTITNLPGLVMVLKKSQYSKELFEILRKKKTNFNLIIFF